MLSVPYFERELYLLPDGEVSAERILALADEVEARVEGGLAPRPLMSVPHILSDESSGYYHAVSAVRAEQRLWQGGGAAAQAGALAVAALPPPPAFASPVLPPPLQPLPAPASTPTVRAGRNGCPPEPGLLPAGARARGRGGHAAAGGAALSSRPARQLRQLSPCPLTALPPFIRCRCPVRCRPLAALWTSRAWGRRWPRGTGAPETASDSWTWCRRRGAGRGGTCRPGGLAALSAGRCWQAGRRCIAAAAHALLLLLLLLSCLQVTGAPLGSAAWVKELQVGGGRGWAPPASVGLANQPSAAPFPCLHPHAPLPARPPACPPRPRAVPPQTPLQQKLEEERRDYEAAVAAGPAVPPGAEPDLDMRILLAHGEAGAGRAAARRDHGALPACLPAAHGAHCRRRRRVCRSGCAAQALGCSTSCSSVARSRHPSARR